MNPNWQTFLAGQGACFDGGRLTGFATAAATPAATAATLVDLSGEGIIAVEGADTRRFLQGQLSTDIDALSPDTSQLSSHSNAKGRVVSVLRIMPHDDGCLLLLPRTTLASVMKRLSMYVLRSRVKLGDASDEYVHIGLVGDTAERLLAAAGLAVPRDMNRVTAHDDIRIVRLHGTTPRFMLIGPARSLASIWEKLATAGAIPANEDHWAWQKILAMEPTIYPETSEHFVAQMIGLEELGAINFRKGCYIGQEIIARAHFRGAVKRHMLRARCAAGDAIAPGIAIENAEHGQPVAEVLDARPNADGIQDMLIVIQDDQRNAPLMLAGTRQPIYIVRNDI
jgi:folate-binding protein YgfZ